MMNYLFKLNVVGMVVLACFSGRVMAQQVASSPLAVQENSSSIVGASEVGQAGVMTALARGYPMVMGSVSVYPDLVVSAGRNSNVVGTNKDVISSGVVSVRPGFVAEVKNQGDRYTASYDGDFTRYANSSSDNANRHEFKAAADHTLDSKTAISWNLGYVDSFDARGVNDRAVLSVPDKWNSPSVGALFSYGSQGATGRFEFDGSMQNKRYTNNRVSTRAFDADLGVFGGRFFYRVAPKTLLLFEVKRNTSNYITALNDNTEMRYLAGVTWDVTAATTGYFKVGVVSKSFKSDGRKLSPRFAWDGRINWTPVENSSFDFSTSKSSADSTGFGDYLLTTSSNVVWSHGWINNVGSKLSFGSTNTDFSGTTRKDTVRYLGFGVTYEMRRWLRLGVELTNNQRTSTVKDREFGRNIVWFTVDATL